jgi:biotin carboxylase
VVVDPVSTGAYYAPAFLPYGIRSIAVRSPGYAVDIAGHFRESDFEFVVDFSGDVEELTKKIGSFGRVSFVLAGSHYGLELADQLATSLGVASANDSSLSKVRHDKFELLNWLRLKGIIAPQQLLSGDLSEIRRWVTDVVKYPVVIKPRASAGTDAVTVCHNDKALIDGYDRIVGKADRYNNVNTHALVQSYVTGREFAVDSVSYEGRHRFICMWEATRDKGAFPFAYVQEMKTSDDEEFSIISKYVASILDACGYRYGPAHTEVILDSSGVPKIIELNARCHGTLDQFLVTASLGVSQVSDVARAYCAARLPPDWDAVPDRHGYSLKVTLVSKKTGRVRGIPRWEVFEELDSYCSSYRRIHIGADLKITRDMPSSPGVIFLHASERQKVWRDYEKLRSVETDFYDSLLLD